MFIDLLLITLIIVFVIDISGAVEHLVYPLVKRLLKIPKTSRIEVPLISCSLCMTFWTGIIYIICMGEFTLLNLFFVCVCAFLTPHIKDLFILVRDTLTLIQNKIYDKLSWKQLIRISLNHMRQISERHTTTTTVEISLQRLWTWWNKLCSMKPVGRKKLISLVLTVFWGYLKL